MSHILVIQGDEAVRTTIGKILELDYHDISLAADPERGLEQVWKQRVDLVICNTIATPEGLETARKIRAQSASLPILSILESPTPLDTTAAPGRGPFAAPNGLGPAWTLAKPLTGAEIRAVVRELLRSESH
jgi:CheY-like chemotaxis protein